MTDKYFKWSNFDKFEKGKEYKDFVKYKSPQNRQKESSLYLLITNFYEDEIASIFKELEKFGDFRIINRDNEKFILVLYDSPEVTRAAKNNCDKYNLGGCSVNILTEEEKNLYLKKIEEDYNFIDREEYDNINSNINRRNPYALSQQDEVYQFKEKSNYKKFIEIFFNL